MTQTFVLVTRAYEYHPRDPSVGLRGQRPHNATRAGVFPWWEGYVTGPVPYTHLRAHETVLEPVCRLLLEKKNLMLRNTA